jgi:speckle-type POZ protein
MDCCICSPMASVYRLPRNTICAPCHEGAKAIIGFLNKADEQQQEEGGHCSVLKSRVSMMKPDSATKVRTYDFPQLFSSFLFLNTF